MKLKKGSKEAKAYMAKIRAKRGKSKKDIFDIGAVRTPIQYKGFTINYIANEHRANSFTGEQFTDKNLAKLKKQIDNFLNPKKVGSTLKVFYVGFKNRKIREKIEAKNATAAIKEYQNRLKPIYGKVPASWLIADKENKVGSTLKLKPNEKRLGATPKDVKGKGYHKDTKSHNVNIRVISGFNDLTTKQKNLYKKLEKEYNKSGLVTIINFENFIDAKIQSAINSKKSYTDLYEIKNFVSNDYY